MANLDEDARKVLHVLALRGQVDITTMAPQEVRDYYAAFPSMPGRDLHEVTQITVAGAQGDLPARLYRPSAAPNLPILVWFHGGGMVLGDLRSGDWVCRELAAQAETLVISVDYRLAPEHKFPAGPEDAYASVAWIAAHATELGGDPARIFVAGHSAGAYNAAMIALDERWLQPFGLEPRRLAGLVGLAGPYNFLPIVDDDIKPIFNVPVAQPDSQPVAHVSGHAPPTLLLVARGDRLVYPERNTEVLAREMRERGDAVTVKTYGGVSHTTLIGAMARPLRSLAPVLDDFSSFVLAH